MARWWAPDGGGFDLLLTPTMAEPPPLLGEIDSDAPRPVAGAGAHGSLRDLHRPLQHHRAARDVGAHLDVAGNLPIGVQLVAATGREDLLLRVAAQLEQRPPVGRPGARRSLANG